MCVLVVTGGNSSERKISLISAQSVKKALEENGYKVSLFDLKQGYPALKRLSKNFDVVFPVIHGEEGEGGKLHKFLSEIDIPYVGGNYIGYRKGWYKIPFKQFCQENNFPTSDWKKIKTKKDIKSFGFPCVLKSSSGGSSREVVILNSIHDLKSYLCNKLLRSNLPLFIEKFLPGVEVTVGILENKALPIVEIIPPKGEWFDYKNKYTGKTKEIVNAPSINPKLQKLTAKIAEQIHQSLNLGPYSRIDFIIHSDIPYVLEVNTIPGFTKESLLPKAALAKGISFPNLVKKLIEASLT